MKPSLAKFVERLPVASHANGFSSAPEDLYGQAIRHLKTLLAQAKSLKLNEPEAMIVSTADKRGRVASRTVLLRALDRDGLVFYTNSESRKGRDLAENPRASLCFYWDALREQAHVEGPVARVSDAEADAYWATRPRESQLGAWASLQSQELSNRARLLSRVSHFRKKFDGGPVPRPPHWTGYRVAPERFEFWKADPFRLNKRVAYLKRAGRWKTTLLYP